MLFKAFVQKYLEDTDFAKTWQGTKDAREEKDNKERLYNIVHAFNQGSLSMKEFYRLLKETHLFEPPGCWTAAEDFLTEIGKFADHYPEEISTQLRLICQQAKRNIGNSIWECYTILVNYQKQYLEVDRPGDDIVSPDKSAFIISLLTFLHQSGGNLSCIYYDKVRLGLKLYLENELDVQPGNLPISSEGVIISTELQYAAVQSILTKLEGRINEFNASHITADPYWVEGIFFWTAQFFSGKEKRIPPPAIPTTTELDLSRTLWRTPTIPLGREIPLSSSSESATFFADEKLSPIEKTVLEKSINDIRLHVLVEETVIWRIYRALLTGHVILVGPPGTGKTELARLLPEVLWQRPYEDAEPTAYTTTLVTATNEWSTRTLIGGIVPQIKEDSVSYHIQYGYLAEAILENWGGAKREAPTTWHSLLRKHVEVESQLDGQRRSFRGRWLVIDEFNRAQIDVALGEALTALDGGIPLRVPAANESGTALLPMPKDFRIIGTLNSFDRNYLNQISEALKRRFSFVEVQPPSRHASEAEMAIVLYKALRDIEHITKNAPLERRILLHQNNSILWKNDVSISSDASTGTYTPIIWGQHHTERSVCEAAWRIFEGIRVYRRLGTAQAIALFRQLLITGILEEYTDQKQWMEEALDPALCDTLADQLQVLLPDELEAIIWALQCDKWTFLDLYTEMLKNLKKTRPHRFHVQLEALYTAVDSKGNSLLEDETKTVLVNQRKSGKAAERETQFLGERPAAEETQAWEKVRETASKAFYLDDPLPHKPVQFIRRLKNFKNERV